MFWLQAPALHHPQSAPEKLLPEGRSFKIKVPFRSEELKTISALRKKTSATLFIERSFAIRCSGKV
jgi:hypothetical protein